MIQPLCQLEMQKTDNNRSNPKLDRICPSF